MQTKFRRFLCVPMLLAVSCALPLRGGEPAAPLPDEKIELPKLAVKGTPICSYGIGVVGLREPGTKKIKRLFVEDVAENSPAQHAGIQDGDEILSINGLKVAGMDGYMKPGSQLFELLINQPPGRAIRLEVVIHNVQAVTLKAVQ